MYLPKNANRTDKSRILGEFIQLTGWNRDYARAALCQAAVLEVIELRLGATPLHDPDSLAPPTTT